MHIEPQALDRDIAAYRDGDDAAADRLCTVLRPVVLRETARMLGDDDADVDDVVQESLVAGLRYLRRERGFEGNLVRLVVTIARNRCRDVLRHRARHPNVEFEPLAVWLEHPGRSALDDLAEDESCAIIQQALVTLGRKCRKLLYYLYIAENSPELVRKRLGLGTVKGVYHRRNVCLEQVRKLVQRRLRFGSWTERSAATRPEPHDGGADS